MQTRRQTRSMIFLFLLLLVCLSFICTWVGMTPRKLNNSCGYTLHESMLSTKLLRLHTTKFPGPPQCVASSGVAVASLLLDLLVFYFAATSKVVLGIFHKKTIQGQLSASFSLVSGPCRTYTTQLSAQSCLNAKDYAHPRRPKSAGSQAIPGS